jgi:hypothetical protein
MEDILHLGKKEDLAVRQSTKNKSWREAAFENHQIFKSSNFQIGLCFRER